MALWAVPFGVVGGRLYHVITDHDLYFGHGKHARQRALRLARRAGHLGRDRARRRRRLDRRPAQGHPGAARCSTRWRPGSWSPRRSAAGATGSTRSCSAGRRPCRGRWRSTPQNRPPGYEQYATFQPDVPLRVASGTSAAFAFVIWADRRFKLGHGRVLALYVMAYTAGRGWIEMLRIDTVEYQHVLGLRLNVWTSIVLFVLAAVYFVVVGRTQPRPRDRGLHRGPPGPRSGRGRGRADRARARPPRRVRRRRTRRVARACRRGRVRRRRRAGARAGARVARPAG